MFLIHLYCIICTIYCLFLHWRHGLIIYIMIYYKSINCIHFSPPASADPPTLFHAFWFLCQKQSIILVSLDYYYYFHFIVVIISTTLLLFSHIFHTYKTHGYGTTFMLSIIIYCNWVIHFWFEWYKWHFFMV